MKNCLPSITLSLIILDLRYHRSGISIRVRHRAKRPAVRLILHAVFDHLGFRVVKKIVSWLRFSLSQSPFFARDLWSVLISISTSLCYHADPNDYTITWKKILSPIFHNTLNAGIPSFVFTRWWMQYMEREHAKHVLKPRFYSNYLLVLSCTNIQGSKEFIPNCSFTCL